MTHMRSAWVDVQGKVAQARKGIFRLNKPLSLRSIHSYIINNITLLEI